MPEDVLFAIFREVVDTEDDERPRNVLPQTNFRLAAVSRTWRRVALDCPQLWQQIVVDARHLQNSDDLARHLERIETLIKYARGTATQLAVANFPGSSWELMEYYMFWRRVFVQALQTASVLALEIDSPTDSALHRAAVTDILSLVASCEAPQLRAAIVGSPGSSLRDALYHSPLPHFLENGRFQHLTIMGIELRPTFTRIPTNSLTTLDLRNGWSDVDVGAVIYGHRHSLQQLFLDNFDVPATGVEFECLPRLTSLAISGRSAHFLTRLHDTLMPSLQRISTGSSIISAALFRSFLLARPTESIHTLTLSVSKGHALALFPLLMTLDRLRFLTIIGHVEPEFFIAWKLHISAAQAQSLDTVAIRYSERLDCCAIAMIHFFVKQRELCNGKTTATLDLRPNGPNIGREMPMHDWVTRALSRLVFVKLNGVTVRTEVLSCRALVDLFAGRGLVDCILAIILVIMCRWYGQHDVPREGASLWITPPVLLGVAANAIVAFRIIVRALV